MSISDDIHQDLTDICVKYSNHPKKLDNALCNTIHALRKTEKINNSTTQIKDNPFLREIRECYIDYEK